MDRAGLSGDDPDTRRRAEADVGLDRRPPPCHACDVDLDRGPTPRHACDGGETADPDGGDSAAPATRTVVEERRLGPMRRTIAERLGESYREAVHVTVHREVDAEALVAATEAADDDLDVAVSPVDVLLLALSATLAEHPAFNATFEDGVHRLHAEHNVGVAVDVEGGLVTPVVADVGARSLPGVARERRRVTELAASGDYSMADLRGGTVTVSNLGPLGVDAFTPVINPPEVAILGVDRLRERAVRSGEGVAFRRHLGLDLSFDHRVVDGADAARLLATLAGHLEDAGDLVAPELNE